MTTNTDFTKMLDALKDSVSQIAAGPAEGRDALLAKSFGEFSDAWTAATQDVIAGTTEEAFQEGLDTSFDKLGKGEDPLYDGMARLGLVMRNAEATVEVLGELLGKSEGHDALTEWVKMGQSAAELYGHSIDKGLAKGEANADLEKAMETARTDLGALQKSIQTRIEKLAKYAEEEGAEDDEIAKVEQIARLAAGIVAICDDVLGGGEEEAPADDNEGNFERSEKAGDLKKAEGAAAADAKPADAKPTEDKPAEAELAKSEPDPKAAEADALRKQVADKDKEIEALKKAAAPAKGVLRAVDKGSDTIETLGKAAGINDLQAEAERLSKLTPEQRAAELIKISQRSPMRIT